MNIQITLKSYLKIHHHSNKFVKMPNCKSMKPIFNKSEMVWINSFVNLWTHTKSVGQSICIYKLKTTRRNFSSFIYCQGRLQKCCIWCFLWFAVEEIFEHHEAAQIREKIRKSNEIVGNRFVCNIFVKVSLFFKVALSLTKHLKGSEPVKIF